MRSGRLRSLALRPVMTLGELTIRIAGIEGSVYRPHRDRLSAPQFKEEIVFTDLEPVEVPSADGGPAGIGWILHHEYKGWVRRNCVGRIVPSNLGVKRHHRSLSVKQEPNPFSSSH